MRFINHKTLAIAGVAAALVAVGSAGTAVAGSLIGSSDIQDDSIRSIDIKDGSVKRADLSNPVNHALASIGEDGVQGPKGDTGDRGAEGPQGPAGADAQVGTYLVQDWFVIPTNGHTEKQVACDAGDVVTGGGYSTSDHEANYTVIHQDRPTWVNSTVEAKPDGWIVQGYGGAHDSKVYVWALCASV